MKRNIYSLLIIGIIFLKLNLFCIAGNGYGSIRLPHGENIINSFYFGSEFVKVTGQHIYLSPRTDVNDNTILFTAPPPTTIISVNFTPRDPNNSMSADQIRLIVTSGDPILFIKNADSSWKRVPYSKVPLNASNFETPKLITGFNNNLLVMTNKGIFQKKDSNSTWKLDTTGLNNPFFYYSVAADSVYNWLGANNGLFKQASGDSVWKRVDNCPINPDFVVVDRNNILWASQFSSLFYSADSGATFHSAPDGLPAKYIIGVEADSIGNIFVITTPNLGKPGNNIFYSQNGNNDFQEIGEGVYQDFGLYSNPNFINSVTKPGDSLVANTSVGIYRTSLGNIDWKYDPAAPTESVNSIARGRGDSIFVSTRCGVFRSSLGDSVFDRVFPSNGFIDATQVFADSIGRIFVLGNKLGANSANSAINAVYQSTDSGDSFFIDTLGVKQNGVAMTDFFVDISGTQHAMGFINLALGSRTQIWQKKVNDPWELDTTGLGPISSSQYGECFGSDGRGNLLVAIHNYSAQNGILFSKNPADSNWVARNVLPNVFVDNITGFRGQVAFGSSNGVYRADDTTTCTQIPMPSGINPANLTICRAGFDSTGLLWSHFTTYNQSNNLIPNIGRGIFSTDSTNNWKKDDRIADSVSFTAFVPFSDSMWTISQNNGVYSLARNRMIIPLKKGWNLVSSNIDPSPADSVNILCNDIKTNLVLMKDWHGKNYIPMFNLNTLGTWDISQAYYMYMTSADTLAFPGNQVSISTPINISKGWNFIPYYGTSPMPVATALSSITDNGNLVLAKNIFGQNYIPAFNINNMIDLTPGMGIIIYVSSEDQLIYPNQ